MRYTKRGSYGTAQLLANRGHLSRPNPCCKRPNLTLLGLARLPALSGHHHLVLDALQIDVHVGLYSEWALQSIDRGLQAVLCVA
jgi:hypothetical protein